MPAILGQVRARLARQISDAQTGPSGYIPLVTLSPQWEGAFAEALTGPPEDRQLAMAPSQLQEFMQRLRAVFEAATAGGESPALLTSGAIRLHVRAIVDRIRPQHAGAGAGGDFPARADPHGGDGVTASVQPWPNSAAVAW